MRHRKPSTCDRSMRAASSIGYLAHSSRSTAVAQGQLILHVQDRCGLRLERQEASPRGLGARGPMGLDTGGLALVFGPPT
jgi:hypothetical protein